MSPVKWVRLKLQNKTHWASEVSMKCVL